MGAENLPTDRPAAGAVPSVAPPVTSSRAYRLAVLGGDMAGMVAAQEAARRRVRVALVLPAAADATPPKSSELAEQFRLLQARMGILPPQNPPDHPLIDVYPGRPRFLSCDALEVGGRVIRFRKAVIATGGLPAAAEVAGAEGCDCLTPETLHSLTELPPRLAVIGCGPAACEWAQAFRRLGSQVHLLARQPALLPDEDPESAAAIQLQLEQDNIRLYLGCAEMAIETTGNLRGVLFIQEGGKRKLLVERVLLCGPRGPNLAGLNLESAGVACTDRGIVVNDRLQTTQRPIFAAGEVCGSRFAAPQAAAATARLAVRNALCLIRRRLSRLVIPRCIHTEPQVVQIGLTRREAARLQGEVETFRIELSASDRSLAEHRRRGFLALHAAARTGRLLGATVVAADADELIYPLSLLLARRWSAAALAEVIPCHPSRCELLQRLAEQVAAAHPLRWQRWWSALCRRRISSSSQRDV